MSRLFCNGVPADAAVLAALAQINYGHFTALPVRGGAVQGLELHLRRLREGTLALFGVELEEARVRAELRRALAAYGEATAWARITVFSQAFDFRAPLQAVPVEVLIALAPLSPAPQASARVQPVVHIRHRPELKHVGTFPLFDLRRQALAQGWDDAVFVDGQDRLIEGTTWNLGLWDGQEVTWPTGPALRGTGEALLRQGLAQAGVEQRDAEVRLGELGAFRAAFACNARGIWPLAAIGGQVLDPQPAALLALLARALASRPWLPV